MNVIGLRRRGFSGDSITMLKTIYTLLYKSGLNVTQAVNKIKYEFKLNEEVSEVLNFIQDCRRGLSK